LDLYASSRLASADGPGNFSRFIGDRMNWNMLFQFIYKSAAPLSDFCRRRSLHPVHKFGYGDGGDDNLNVAGTLLDGGQ
jgi:hypothetical protein